MQLNPDAEHISNFYKGFRLWLDETYHGTTPSEEQLNEVYLKDQTHNYELYPTSPSPEELAELSTEEVYDAENGSGYAADSEELYTSTGVDDLDEHAANDGELNHVAE